MSTKSPIFPMPQPQHYSDYGFDPQIDYFQVLEEAMKHKREARSIDTMHFKLQKPTSKDESLKIHKPKRKRWWKNALLFFKWRRPHHSARAHRHSRDVNHDDDDMHRARARAFRASMSGPVYMTECTSGSTTPYKTASRPSSGPLDNMPYLSLRQLTMEQQRMSTSAVPIYLVT